MTEDREAILAGGPMDNTDAATLALLRTALEAHDPPPRGLAERISFAMTVRALEAEVAQLTSGRLEASVRSTAYDRATSLTFGSDSLSIMISLDDLGEGRTRITGWTSVGGVEVELRERARTRTATSDTHGRFSFDGVERGIVHFVFRRDPADGFAPLITPGIEI